MKLVVWSPGILGSRLRRVGGDHLLVWPPGETDSEDWIDDRTFDQLTSNLRVDGIVDSVLCFPVYRTVKRLFEQAGYAPAGAGGPLQVLAFAYDWRMDLQTVAGQLAARLDALTRDGDEITLLGHSMGALLSRYVCEAPVFDGRPFKRRLKRLISVNGPQAGAAVMAARALGAQATEHIVAADGPRVVRAPGFSGGMDLLPPPGHPCVQEGARWLDLYDAAVVSRFGLGPNVAAAQAFWRELGRGAKPASVHYVCVHGLIDRDEAVERVYVADGRFGLVNGRGDGTVTEASALAMASDVVVTLPGDHLGVLDGEGFRTRVFAPFVGAPPAVFFEAAVASVQLRAVHQQAVAGADAAFVLVGSGHATPLKARLAWVAIGRSGTDGPPVKSVSVTVPVGPAPVFDARAPARPSLYRVALVRPGAALSPPTTVIQVRAASPVQPAAPPPP